MEKPTSPAIAGVPASTSKATAAPSDENSFADILSEFEQRHRGASPGQAIEGRVVSISADAIFVDIGRKMDGVLPADRYRDASGALSIRVGDKLLVSIT